MINKSGVHRGAIGDLIYALPLIKHLNINVLYLLYDKYLRNIMRMRKREIY